MIASVASAAIVGLHAVPVTIEVDIPSTGLPSFTIVGLADKAVDESKERVRSAIKNSGADFPSKKIVVNLAPADLPKTGPSYDLAIAIGILIASGQLQASQGKGIFIGELSLDGSVRHTNGVLPVVQSHTFLQSSCFHVPFEDAKEASIIPNITLYGIPDLRTLITHLTNTHPLNPIPTTAFSSLLQEHTYESDMADVMGQEHVKRALEIAAAGGHNMLMIGPPGSGKTMLARLLPTILPSLSETEALEVTTVYSITGLLPPHQSIVTTRPFRSPHHTTSQIGLIGGGSHPMPGEISLAHRGVLFLDEFPEFPRHVIEALRQPIEDGFVSVSRASGTITFPSKCMLIAASNPCPCGYHGSTIRPCTCLPATVARYKKRISGPIIDRIDIHVAVPFVETTKLTQSNGVHESSTMIRTRVQLARTRQEQRYCNTSIVCNAELSAKQIKTYCPLSNECLTFIQRAVDTYRLSARSYYRMIKLSQTIADIESAEHIELSHIAEALQYRPTS